jgi:hypothetical protein
MIYVVVLSAVHCMNFVMLHLSMKWIPMWVLNELMHELMHELCHLESSRILRAVHLTRLK